MPLHISSRRAFLSMALLAIPSLALAHKAPETGPAYVKMVTSLGDITLELNRAKAPVSTANFLKYVDKKFYDGTIFHRVIPDFMIQGGGFTPDMTQKRGEAPIKNEWQNGLKNARGSIAMARTSDPDSATSQFFINVKDNGFLDQARDGAAYAVFGKVVEGMATVDKIKAVATTDKGPYQNVPETAVVIKSARRLTDDEVKALKARLAKGEKK
jgi:cyclophilin family peptidyl-prolyl cis-trans isomerase